MNMQNDTECCPRCGASEPDTFHVDLASLQVTHCDQCQLQPAGHPQINVSDEDAAQHVLDAAADAFRGQYVPETERPGLSGFLLHLYVDLDYKERAATFEILGRHSLKFTWMIEPDSAARTKVVQSVDQFVQEAYGG